MGFFSKLFDDVLGFDPNGGGIYSTARNVLGDTVADDWLGMDPTGKGAIGAYNVLGPLALTAGAGYAAAPYLSGMAGGFGSTLPGAAGGAMADLSMAPELASLMGGSSVPVGQLGMGAGIAGGASGIGSAATAGSWLSRLASGLTGGSGGTGGYGSLISQLLNTGSGIYGMKLAGDARKASDPFAKYRPGYGATLANLEANPSQIQTRPGFQAGLEAITRNTAGKGYLGSGNEAAALMRYSGDFYNQEASRLAQLAGAGQTPGAGQFGAADLASKSLGSIGYGVAPQTQPGYNSNQLLQLALSQLMRP